MREGKFEEAEVVLRRALSAAIDRYRGNPTELDDTLARLQIALYRLGKEQESEEAESWAQRRKEAFRRGRERWFYGESGSQERPMPKPRADLVLEQAQRLAIKNEYKRETIWDYLEACNEEGSIYRAIFDLRTLLKLYELQRHPALAEVRNIWLDLLLPGGFGSLPEPRPEIVIQRRKTKVEHGRLDPARMNPRLPTEWKLVLNARIQQLWSRHNTAIGTVVFRIHVMPGRRVSFERVSDAWFLLNVTYELEYEMCLRLVGEWLRQILQEIEGDPLLDLPEGFKDQSVEMRILVSDELVYEASYRGSLFATFGFR
ncbi:MAG TPA: hypothetical protein V6D08_01610 [Candidatus Obscuribacterales bacterium]